MRTIEHVSFGVGGNYHIGDVVNLPTNDGHGLPYRTAEVTEITFNSTDRICTVYFDDGTMQWLMDINAVTFTPER